MSDASRNGNPPKILIFSQKSCFLKEAYISGNRDSEKAAYVSGSSFQSSKNEKAHC